MKPKWTEAELSKGKIAICMIIETCAKLVEQNQVPEGHDEGDAAWNIAMQSAAQCVRALKTMAMQAVIDKGAF